jgi:hypothetical protein
MKIYIVWSETLSICIKLYLGLRRTKTLFSRSDEEGCRLCWTADVYLPIYTAILPENDNIIIAVRN